MKGLGVFFVATLTMLVGSLVVIRAASGPRPEAVSRRCVLIGCQASSSDAAFREAAARWRRCQPHHWRMCLLQR